MVDRDYCCGKQEINFAIVPLVFKVDQGGAVNSVLDGHDVVAVLATGFGKSLVQPKRGSRGTIVKFPGRQLHFIQSRRCFSVTMTSRFEKVDEKYIQELKANGESENTKNSTEW